MSKMIIWGTGQGYNKHFNLIKHFELVGEITVLGIMSNDKDIGAFLDGYKVYKKTQIKDVEFDYCLMTMKESKEVLDEAVELGIPREKIIPIRVLEIPYFSFKKYIQLKQEGVSILSRNCWGGICYHRLALPFCSPTINMFFSPTDFNKFISNLDHYLALPVEFGGMKYDQIMKRDYPMGILDDIILHFNHYINFDEAVSAWTRRKERMTGNIVVVSSTTEKDDAIEFAKLPFKNKLIFIPKELEVEDDCFLKLTYEHDEHNTIGMYSNGTAGGRLSMIDLLAFLCSENYNRIVFC